MNLSVSLFAIELFQRGTSNKTKHKETWHHIREFCGAIHLSICASVLESLYMLKLNSTIHSVRVKRPAWTHVNVTVIIR